MDTVLVLDFGSQFSHLIARRVRDLGVYAEVVPDDISPDEIRTNDDVKGLILSGGVMSVYDDSATKLNSELLTLGIPVLGICYGHQLIAQTLGGVVKGGSSGEYGRTVVTFKTNSALFSGVAKEERVLMNHKDTVEELPSGFERVAVSENDKVAGLESVERRIYGVQFHPEVTHTASGNTIFSNFLDICGVGREYTTRALEEHIVGEACEELGDTKAIIGLSGGIDSTVASFLASRAIGKNLTAIYVDTGLMRYRETEDVRESFKDVDVKLRIVDARDEFFRCLRGVTDPEEKRKAIGKTFIDVFTREARTEGAEFLIQGTIYSDRVESGGSKHAANIKSHHNVGGLPEHLGLKIYEPLRELYKDEVRGLAKVIGVPDVIRGRQVFPGPGLAIRIIGEVTPEKVDIVRRAGHIIETELRNTEYWSRIWMSFPVLLSVKSVGVQGDGRSYKYPLVLRIVESTDAMTANAAELPFAILDRISSRITNEISEVNRVVYDITHKPPATMEWE